MSGYLPTHLGRTWLFLLALIASSFGDVEFKVDNVRNLDSIAARIQSATEGGTYQVRFHAYTNTGRFRVQSSKAEAIIFSRAEESDSVLDVRDVLFDIKGVQSTIIFRNLAFRLANPAAVLLSGADEISANGSLIFDSCFIVSDNSSARFIAWNGGPQSQISMVNSMLFSQNGSPSMALRAGRVILENNSFHFAGLISTLTQVELKVRFNTFNRTQLAGEGGVAVTSDFFVNYNLFASAPKVGVLGGNSPYPVRLRDFAPLGNSIARNNKRYSTWAGWEPSGSTHFREKDSNMVIAPIPGLDSTEIWKWRMAGDSVGFGFSQQFKVPPFNVFPSDETFSDELDGKPLTFTFQKSVIPRVAKAEFSDQKLVSFGPNLRPVWPRNGGIKLGVNTTFILRRLQVGNLEANQGSAVLLAAAKNQGYRENPGGANSSSTIAVFENTFPSAQYFHPAFFSSLARGRFQVPSDLPSGDTLRFDSVALAGKMSWLEPDHRGILPRNARFLQKSFGFLTNAELGGGNLLFGMDTAQALKPFDLTTVRWLVREDTSLHAATLLNRKYVATIPRRASLNAFLVELLTAPQGSDSLELPDGLLKTRTAQGFQIRVDSMQPVDRVRYSEVSSGYKVGWTGRLPEDSVHLVLDARTSVLRFHKRVYRQGPAGAEVVGSFSEKDSTVHVALGPEDSSKVFFAAIENNVLAGRSVDGPMPNVTRVQGYVSDVSGRLDFKPVGQEVLQAAIGEDLSLFRDVIWLGGRSIEYYKAAPNAAWSLTFPIGKAKRPDSVRVYFTTGQRWEKLTTASVDTSGELTVGGIPAGAVLVVAVEGQTPAISMVTPAAVVRGSEFKVQVAPKTETPITRYCVELRQVDNFGKLDSLPCSPRLRLDESFSLPLPGNFAYQYRLRWFVDTVEYGVPPAFDSLQGFAWSPTAVLIGKRPLRQDVMHVAGFPYEGTFRNLLKRSVQPPPRDVQDLNLVYRLRTVGGEPRLDVVANPDTLKVKPGTAVMVGSARPYDLQLDAQAVLARPAVRALPLDSGWQFVANPFPISCRLASVKTSRKAPMRFYELTVDTTKQPADYDWDLVTEVLKSFTGFAYKAEAGEVLEFDLFRQAPPAPKRAVSGDAPALYRASLESPLGRSTMWLSTHPDEKPTGFLPPLGGTGVELRVGGGEGFLLKPILDARKVDEPVVIRSPRATRARFTLAPADGAAPATRYRLLDLATGEAIDPAEGELSLAAGTRQYRLLAGEAAFVAERLQAFRAGIPVGMALAQNHPNPFRGHTRIALDWPADLAGDRTAALEVLDVAGRRVWKTNLRDIRVGRQVLSVDATGWKPGIYLYRLLVTGGGRSVSLEKRMVVLP